MGVRVKRECETERVKEYESCTYRGVLGRRGNRERVVVWGPGCLGGSDSRTCRRPWPPPPHQPPALHCRLRLPLLLLRPPTPVTVAELSVAVAAAAGDGDGCGADVREQIQSEKYSYYKFTTFQ